MIHEEERECFNRDPTMYYCLDIKTDEIIRMFKNEQKTVTRTDTSVIDLAKANIF